MKKSNFETMSRQELITYILEHRDEDEPFYILIDRAKAEPGKIYPTPQSIEDLKNFSELLEKHRRQKKSSQNRE